MEQYLKDNPGVKRIVLCLDNDAPGRAAASAIKEALAGYEIIDNPPRRGKDYNDQLQLVKGISGRVKTVAVRRADFLFSAGLGLQAACGCFAVASIGSHQRPVANRPTGISPSEDLSELPPLRDPAVRQGCGWTGVPLYFAGHGRAGSCPVLQTAVSRSYRQDDSKTNERK